MTIAEKILARASGRKKVMPNEIVMARVDKAMSHENADVVLRSFKDIGLEKVWDNERIIILFDHRIPADSQRTAETHRRLRKFVKEQQIKYFYDQKEGICHQILAEFGHDLPGDVLVGTDSHTTTHGAFGMFATGIGATEMAGVWATGELWLRVPESIRLNITGKFRPFVSAKDLILHIIGKIEADGANYQAVEFHGEVISKLSMASRMVLSNLSMEMGAKVALIPPDHITTSYLEKRTNKNIQGIAPDADAQYIKEINIEISDLPSQVACPHTVDNVKNINEVAGIKVDQALIGSCTNGRLEDLEVAAKILENKTVHQNTRLLIIPASRNVYLEALRKGYLEIFIKAGGLVLNPGCGPCLGAHQGLLASEEVCIATTNRNFKGRMGSPEAFVYLASPGVVAASAIKGEITEPC